MEFTILAGLLGAGYYLTQDGKNTRETLGSARVSIDPSDQTNHPENVYTSTLVFDANKTEKDLSDKNWEKSKDPVNTNIIPILYNDPSSMIRPAERNAPKSRDELQRRLIAEPVDDVLVGTKLTDLTTLDIAPSKETTDRYGSADLGSDIVKQNLKEPEHQFLSRSFDAGGFSPILKKDAIYEMPFTHNNMVPFFGSSV